MTNTPADFQQRQQALDPNASIICEAPAGSGKTELLTQRFLTLLARVNTPEEIVAITFTRKAAGEMRERILSALHRGMDDTSPDSDHQMQTWNLARTVLQRDADNHWDIIDNPNRLNVLTFDSLCAKLANSLPLHSSFGAPPQVVENAEEYYRIAARNVLQTLEDEKPWSDAIADILRHLDNNVQRLENLLIKMLGQREAWLPLIGIGAGASKDGEHSVIAVLEHNLARVQQDTILKLSDLIPAELHRAIVEFCAFAAGNLQGSDKNSPFDACLNMDVATTGEDLELPDDSESGLQQWQGIAHLLLKADNDWRLSLDKRMGFPAGDNAQEKKRFKEIKQQCLTLIATLKDVPGLHELLLDLRSLPAAHYQPDQQQTLISLSYVLPVLSAYLSLVFREKNSVDFSEISIKARMALGSINDDLEHDPANTVSELAMKLDYKIQHILIDEFQDTSPAQIELLTQLTQGWTPGDGRTLFCVGDAMQSIYGFRGANVGLFIRCIEHGLGHIPLSPIRLNTNFRSQAGVVDWINDVFADAFPARSDISNGAVHYSPSIAFQQALPEPAVQAHVFAEGKSAEHEAQLVLDIVQEARQKMPSCSIAILIRSRSHVAHITPVLQEAGLKYRAVDLEPLASNMVIQDLMVLTHALLDPADRIAWLSILRAPWCGLTLQDLETLIGVKDEQAQEKEREKEKEKEKEKEQPLTILQQLQLYLNWQQPEKATEVKSAQAKKLEDVQPDLFGVDFSDSPSVDEKNTAAGFSGVSEDGKARLNRVAPILLEAFQQAQRKSLRQWIEGAWISIGGPACLSKSADLKNAQLFFELLEKLDNHTVLEKKHALLEALQRLFAVPDPDADESLQIMTIHKSKGLEFDVVIVPQLHRTSRSPDPELLRWYERLTEEGETQLLMAPITASGKDKDPTYQHLVEQEKKKGAYENCRLLYVACTRAKKHLHLSALVTTDSKKPENKFQNTAKSSLLNPIWQPLQIRAKLYKQEDVVPESEGQAPPVDNPRALSRLPARWQLPDLEHCHVLDPYVPFFQHNNEEFFKLETKDTTARIVGTVVHRVIQQMGDCDSVSRQAIFNEAFISLQQGVWRNKMLALGMPPAKLAVGLGNVSSAVRAVIADARLQQLLEVPSTHRKHEFPVSLPGEQDVKQLVIDMLVERESVVWIIDFKTSHPMMDEDTDRFIENEKAQYAAQMRQYQRAVLGLPLATGKDVKTALYFPHLGLFAEYQD